MARYVNCKFCHGSGCIGCYEESKRRKKYWSPPDLEENLKDILGCDALQKIFREGGGCMDELFK